LSLLRLGVKKPRYATVCESDIHAWTFFLEFSILALYVGRLRCARIREFIPKENNNYTLATYALICAIYVIVFFILATLESHMYARIKSEVQGEYAEKYNM